MPGRNFLFVPGPTNVPDRVLNAMHRAMEDHRSPVFPKLPLSIFPDLKKVFRTTDGQPFVFAATGTGMWEAALVNTCSPGDKRARHPLRTVQPSLHRLRAAPRPQVDIIDVPWGEGAPPDKIEEKLRADTKHEYKGVLVVHNETATGVTSDIAAVRKAIDNAKHPGAALRGRRELGWQPRVPHGRLGRRSRDHRIAKGIHASRRTRPDRREPEGAGASREREAAARLLRLRRPDQGERHWLLPVHARAHAALRIARVARHAARGRARQRLRAPPPAGRGRARRGQGVGTLAVREGSEVELGHGLRGHDAAGVDGAQVIATAFKKYNLALGAGLGQMAGKLFRIGHLGDLNELMLLGALAGAEMAMRDVGMTQIVPGSGVGAAAEYLARAAAAAQAAARRRRRAPRSAHRP